jgi:hypothetical protein
MPGTTTAGPRMGLDSALPPVYVVTRFAGTIGKDGTPEPGFVAPPPPGAGGGGGDDDDAPPPARPMFQVLPYLRPVSARWPDGAEPHRAQVRYIFQSAWESPFPSRIEQVMPVDAVNPLAVRPDDRLQIWRLRPNGVWECLADGFALVTQADTSGGEEQASFQLVGVPVREWDRPLDRSIWRDGTDLELVPEPDDEPPPVYEDSQDVSVALPIRFNPDGRPNCSPEDCDHVLTEGQIFPVFVDPLIVRDPDVRRHWTLDGAARLLCALGNPKQKYVKNPDFVALQVDLGVLEPAEDGGEVDPDDPESYKVEPITLPDIDLTGRAWPEAMAQLLEPHGFGCRFVMDQPKGLAPGDFALPTHRLEVFRLDALIPQRPLYLQAANFPGLPAVGLDLALTNAPTLRLARDNSALVNEVQVRTGPRLHEVAILLVKGFKGRPDDLLVGPDGTRNREVFDSTHPDHHRDGNDIRYRLFIGSEAGDPWWDSANNLQDPATGAPFLDLKPALGDEPNSLDPDRRIGLVRRRRPPLGDLLTTDTFGRPVRAELYISTGYTDGGPGHSPPCIWPIDDPSVWQKVHDGWQLWDRGIGIMVTAKEPWSWNIGRTARPAADQPYPAGIVDVMTATIAPSDEGQSGKAFTLKLVCVIEGDRQTKNKALYRPASPTDYKILRLEDQADRFQDRERHISSPYALDPATGNRDTEVLRDDTDEAQRRAEAIQRYTEVAGWAGTATIPWVTTAYRVGTKVPAILGRDLSLDGLAVAGRGQPGGGGAGAGPAAKPHYPTIVEVALQFDPVGSTTLHLHDRRGQPPTPSHLNRADTRRAARAAADPEEPPA